MTDTSNPGPGQGDTSPLREWDARSYHAVSEPQFEWGRRVLSTLELRGDEHAMDAGAGTGRLTSLLLDRLPRGRAVAVDRSVNMTVVARETLARFPNADVVAADLSYLPFARAFDVVFSTATFHWVRDHDRLFASLFAVLRGGGRLHAQCGGKKNLDRIHHRAHDLMSAPEFSSHFVSWQEPWEYASAEATRERLMRAGFRDVHAAVEESPVTFADADAFRAFISTVVMRPFLARLPAGELRDAFLDRIVAHAAADSPAFTLDYWRLNLSAVRP
jgi:trans-aconitate 2-methyltransferase